MKLQHRTSSGVIAALCLLGALAGCSAGSAPSSDDPSPSDTVEGTTEERLGERLTYSGPTADALINASQLRDLTFTVSTTGEAEDLAELVVLLDGADVTDEAAVSTTTLTYTPGSLSDGERTVAIRSRAGQGTGDETDVDAPDAYLHAWRFEVETQPPSVEVTSPVEAVAAGDPVTLAGVTEPGAAVAVDDAQTRADDSGHFSLELGEAQGPLTIVVTDIAGNTTEIVHDVRVVASRVEIDEIRTVHAASWAWANPGLRDPILEMLDDGRINSLQLDLKDEAGHLGYDSEVPLAQEMGAVKGPLDLERTVADLHEQGVPVIGRIVAFADPTLASWAWENGRRDWVIQLPDGSDFYRGSYAGFSNYTHADVIAYNLDIAEEAAEAGVDHILWDYIRRPEGIDNYTVPGLTSSPEEAIVEFSRLADERLAPYGIQHGASVYGIAADRPTQIGQDIPAMADHLDYVAPMLYPSHWGPGEYGVADPNRQPYDIIRATLEVWDDAVAGRRARVVPWLEDTPYRSWNRPLQIREQIRAAHDHGIDEWLMWNPGSTFTPEAYDPRG